MLITMIKTDFRGRILILGCGAVAQCLQVLLLRHIAMDISHITLVDTLDMRNKMEPLMQAGARFVQTHLTAENIEKILSTYLQDGDILIELAISIDTATLVQWCYDHNVMFLNSALQTWPSAQKVAYDIQETSYMHRLRFSQKTAYLSKNGPTAVIAHGANPGLVSHFVKSALIDLAQILLVSSADRERLLLLEQALSSKNFAQLSLQTGTKIIHIAERDTQITCQPKQLNEFINTWSVNALYQECIALPEIGWGTHEQKIISALKFVNQEKTVQYIAAKSLNVWMRSWVPTGEMLGMLISHEEIITIHNYLTVRENNALLYSPTVCFIYLVCDSAFASLHECKMNKYKLQENQRIIDDDIVSGSDQLGVLLLGHDLKGWWMGSDLSIEQTRSAIGNGHNATTLQVCAGLLGALLWMIRNPRQGVCNPEVLPHEEILAIAQPYLGTIISQQILCAPKDTSVNNWQTVDFFDTKFC